MKSVLLFNGTFLTFTKKTINVKSVLLDNGFIKRISFKKENFPKNIQRIDLKGNYVIPGFIDSHTHLVSKGIELQRTDLEKCISLDECLEKLRSELHKNDEIVFGVNWDESSWSKSRRNTLNRNVLDKISKKKAIIMRRICGHLAVVNTKALNLIPRNWKIVDRLNGYLYEDVVLNLNEIFKPSTAMIRKAIDLAITHALASGITSIHEITVPRQFKLLQELNKKHKLKLRIASYIPVKYFDSILSAGVSSGLGDDYLKFAGIKLFIDGSIGARTAALTRPYRHTRTKGKLLISTHRFKSIVKNAEENGIQLMIHSIGDRATVKVLKIFNNYIDRGNALRHRLEHLEILDNHTIAKIAKMNVIASMQPNFVRRWQIPGGMYEQYLGKRYKKINCFKKLLAAGARVVFGSDCMPLGPLYGIHGAVKHPFPCGRLKPSEAFRLYTKEGAYASFDEDKKGTIENNKFADLVVLNKNPLEETNLEKMKILMVFVGGNIVYTNVLDNSV